MTFAKYIRELAACSESFENCKNVHILARGSLLNSKYHFFVVRRPPPAFYYLHPCCTESPNKTLIKSKHQNISS